ncbi:MAG: DHH family phosphoesterase, partial [Planctomycetota bacterium]
MAKQWMISAPSPDCEALACRLRVPPVIAQVLINRGLSLDGTGEAFLLPQLKDLHPPQLLPGASEAAARIVDAIHAKTKIVLYGDYDVDGTTGVAILWHVLRQAGAEVTFYVPHRIDEGYGLNLEAVKRLVEDGAGMIVSVDCGITAVDIAKVLKDAGVTLIITDHHAPHAELPDAAVIVHPSVGGTYPNPHLSGAGVAFKLAWAIAQRLSGADRVTTEFRELLRELLPLAAIGT